MSAAGAPRVLTEPLGGSALSRAVQARQLPAGIQPWSPVSPVEWKTHVARTRDAAPRRWLSTLAAALAASGAAAERLKRAENGVVVTTGQQAGLFGGPLYTLAKALTALQLADVIERETGVAAAPVFWAATDDADFLEASTAHVADAGGLRELRLTQAPPAGTPMAGAPLGEVTGLVSALRAACGSAAHAEYFEMARDAYGSGASIGAAYVRLLRALLEPLGIAVLDSSHPATRAAARPTLVAALQKADAIARAASERAVALRAAGFDPQVEDDRGLSLVFAIENGIKRRVAVTQAAAAATSNAELVPNVLLRPVAERATLPTIAYVGGPGELAYFTQSAAVADALGLAPAVGVPRWSCTIVEPFADRALKRLDVDYQDVRELHALERKLAAAAIPKTVDAAWRRLQEQVHAAVRNLGAAVAKADLMPTAVIEGLERSIAHRLTRTERRILAAVKRRDERTRHDLAVASGALFPMGKRQERVLNFIPMLARGGEPLLEAMNREAAGHARSLLKSKAAKPKPVAAR